MDLGLPTRAANRSPGPIKITVHFSGKEEKEVEPCPVHRLDRLVSVLHVRFVAPDRGSDGKPLSGSDRALGE